jgi:hypothetical protein
MPGMPYHLEKGPLLSVLEDFCNRGPEARLVKALKELRAGTPLPDVGPFDSPNLYWPRFPWPYQNPGQLIAHFNDHWLGIPPTSTTHTGHWQFYEGPVEDIMRETMIRALELVLGVDHDPADEAPVPTRHWLIDFFWKCPQPWFEGWVSWRKLGQGWSEGKVTVIFATPADDGVVLRDPRREADLVPNQVANGSEGSWLVSSALHTQNVQLTVVPTSSGSVIFPTTWTVDTPNIVVVAPRFGSGGSKNGGMPYTGPK